MVTKLLIQLGLDPGNVTFDAIFNRLADIALQSINLANMLALLGAVFYVTTLLMRTIVPLRIFGILCDMFFIGYGVLANSLTTFFLYLLLLPINSVRLYQMLKLEESEDLRARRSVDELARALHDSTQVSQGRRIVWPGGRRP
jgi:hypothetical protein